MADTHVTERSDRFATFAEPSIRPRLAPFGKGEARVLCAVSDAAERFQALFADRTWW